LMWESEREDGYWVTAVCELLRSLKLKFYGTDTDTDTNTD